jgi:UDP-N-acetyl-D-mannosaminuronate dehydrogenase
MSAKQRVVVAGLGEIGKPILELVSSRHTAIGIDVDGLNEPFDAPDVLHVCYPFQIADFVAETARYLDLFKPQLTIIHSTVAIGTTRAVADRTGMRVVNSPVRGKHARMLADLRHYTKFIGGFDEESSRLAVDHLQSLGIKTRVLPSAEATEVAKLTETTYFGVLIAWAQEVERYCDALDVRYEDVIAFYKEIGYLPPVEFSPGVIGGHCVMPNIEILGRLFDSEILDAIKGSNRRKIARQAGMRDLREALPVASAL